MEEIINCSLTELNSKKKIFKIFGIPAFAQQAEYDFSVNYELKYLKKGSGARKSKRIGERIDDYLSIEKKESPTLDAIPKGENKKDYRTITHFKKGSEWLKRAQKKFHKIISNGIKDVPYLKSTLKDTSYAKNGIAHSGSPKDMFFLDLKSFFEQVDSNRINKRLKKLLKLDSDVSLFYSKMLTSQKDESKSSYVLGQGLPSSPILSFLCYKSLFDYIYDISNKAGITFTIYVDDITFSSDKEIPQSFINTIMGLLKSKTYGNELIISKKKIRKPSKTARKRITGVYLDRNGKPGISKKKHEELFSLYEAIITIIHKKDLSFEDYFKLFNLVLKFNGNFIYLCEVQYNGDLKTDGNIYTHQKYALLYRTMMDYFKIGIEKDNKKMPYAIDNIGEDDKTALKEKYQQLLDDKNKLMNQFPLVKSKNS